MCCGEVAILVSTDTHPVVSTRVLAIGLLPDVDVGDPLVDHLVAFRHYPLLYSLLYIILIDNLVIVLSYLLSCYQGTFRYRVIMLSCYPNHHLPPCGAPYH